MPAPGTRITAGTQRGRRLRTRPGLRTRPTTALVRQALFNIIGESIKGASVLDLFAGSGALGLEALSRGAEHVTFVDQDKTCVTIVTENLAATGFAQQADVHRADSIEWLKAGAGDLTRFHLILVDPPYRFPPLSALLGLLARLPLRPDALLALEHHRGEAVTPPARLRIVRQSDYGMTRLTFLRYVPT